MGFRTRLHRRSLESVWNDIWWLWWSMISGDKWEPSFPIFILQMRKNPEKNPQPEKMTQPGIEPRKRCYPSITAEIFSIKMFIYCIYFTDLHYTHLGPVAHIPRDLPSLFPDSGGAVVITLATGSEVRGLKPGRGRWIFSDRKSP